MNEHNTDIIDRCCSMPHRLNNSHVVIKIHEANKLEHTSVMICHVSDCARFYGCIMNSDGPFRSICEDGESWGQTFTYLRIWKWMMILKQMAYFNLPLLIIFISSIIHYFYTCVKYKINTYLCDFLNCTYLLICNYSKGYNVHYSQFLL